MSSDLSHRRYIRLFNDQVVFSAASVDSDGGRDDDIRSLVINRDHVDGSCEMQLLERGEEVNIGGGGAGDIDKGQVLLIDGIYGMYELLSGPYIAVILESKSVFRDDSKRLEFRQVSRIAIIPLFSEGKPLSEERRRDEDRYLELLNAALSSHTFYFSHRSDVTHTLQRGATLSSDAKRLPLHARADDRFFWNRQLVGGLLDCGADEWITPVMSAFVAVRPGCEVSGRFFTYMLVSRRSCFRQGCRFLKRGIDEKGNVANFVETEQVLLFAEGHVTAHVQVRGSIPVFWSSPATMKYAPAVVLDTHAGKSSTAFQRHCRQLLSIYGRRGVVCINLIDRKKDQRRLGEAYEQVVEQMRRHKSSTWGGYSPPGAGAGGGGAGGGEGRSGSAADHQPVKLVWFDFHHECRKMRWHNLSKLVRLVDEDFVRHGHFEMDRDGKVIRTQTGVLRTNCMDNLDRTNVVQSLFARRALLMQLEQTEALELNVLEAPFPVLERAFRDIWADHADAMSHLYAGTGALKTDFTRTGQRTQQGMLQDLLNSCKRFWINNFLDGPRQDGLDLLLGRYTPDGGQHAASPFTQLKAGQEPLRSLVAMSYALLMLLFALLSFLKPSGTGGNSVTSNLGLALTTTAALLVAILWQMLTKGKLGRHLVVRPCLCKDDSVTPL